MNRISNCLSLAAKAIDAHEYSNAIGWLQLARQLAMPNKSRKGRIIAAHCVVAQQALLPYLMGIEND